MEQQSKTKLIRIDRETEAALDKKSEPRESYNDTIKRLLGIQKKKLKSARN